MPASHLSFFRDNLPPHARVDEPEHFGHSPYLEAPGAVMRRIIRFLTHIEAP